jgi:hypothetical protein
MEAPAGPSEAEGLGALEPRGEGRVCGLICPSGCWAESLRGSTNSPPSRADCKSLPTPLTGDRGAGGLVWPLLTYIQI